MGRVKFVGKAKLTKQGQTTIPLEARKDLGISPKEELFFYESGTAIVALKKLVRPEEVLSSVLSGSEAELEDLKETFEILNDRKLMRDIIEAEKQIKRGELKSLKDFEDVI